MVASPCKKCRKKAWPKDVCMATCKIINQLQEDHVCKTSMGILSVDVFQEEHRLSFGDRAYSS